MAFWIVAVGSFQGRLEKQLYDLYQKRIHQRIHLCEVPNRPNRLQEAILLLKQIPKEGVCIALDERGEDKTSQELADGIQAFQRQGTKHIVFIIGGADGLDQQVLDRCSLKLCLGRLTWPHLLVRVLLMEQLYRIECIQNNHPYHR